MRARLVGDDVGREPAREQLGQDLGGVADEPDRDRLAGAARLVAPTAAPRRGRRVSRSRYRVSRRRSMRAGSTSTHRATPPFIVTASGCAPPIPPSPPVSVDASRERPAEVLRRRLGERLVRALQDPLRADVDPRARGHLAVHRQARRARARGTCSQVAHFGTSIEFAIRTRGAIGVGPEDADRLARLDEQRLVVAEGPQRPHDRVERLPGPRGLARPAVDDEVLGTLGDLGVEVVHEHPQRGLLRPRPARELGAAGRSDLARAHARDDRTGRSGWLRPAAWWSSAAPGARRCARRARACRTA